MPAQAGSPAGQQILLLVIIIAAFYFILIRPQKSKEKKAKEMLSKLAPGDMITTIGGIVGRVVNIKENSDIIVIETGADRNRMQVRKWAISTNDTPMENDTELPESNS
jgi:preprotein translocase subunit YajC